MKTSLTIFPCVLGSTFPIIRVCPGLSFATKRIGPPWCTLFTFVTCCSLQSILSQNYLSPLISVLAENTLLKTAYQFLLLFVGFDTLTYRKDYDRSPILVGHHVPRAGWPPPCSFIYGGRGHPRTHKLTIVLAMCSAPLHSYTPRSYRRSA